MKPTQTVGRVVDAVTRVRGALADLSDEVRHVTQQGGTAALQSYIEGASAQLGFTYAEFQAAATVISKLKSFHDGSAANLLSTDGPALYRITD